MWRQRIPKLAAVLLAAGIWAATARPATAAIVLNLDSVITGGSPASTTRPWLTAQFDSLANNRVKFTLSAPNLVNNEDVHEWLFNIDPHVTQAQLNSLTIVSRTLTAGSFQLRGISLIREVVDGVTRAGFSFDFDFGFPNGNPAQRFTRGDQVEIVLGTTLSASILTLNERTFNYLDDTGTYRSAAHIRNTTVGGDSGWIGTSPVPESSTSTKSSRPCDRTPARTAMRLTGARPFFPDGLAWAAPSR